MAGCRLSRACASAGRRLGRVGGGLRQGRRPMGCMVARWRSCSAPGGARAQPHSHPPSVRGMAGPETAATRELRSLSRLLERRFIELTDRVFVAAGYGMSTFSFVLGDTGIVAVDAGGQPDASAEAIAELRRHSDLPILGLVYTHGHPDHTGGAGAFVNENPDIEIWAIERFGDEGRHFIRNGAAIALERAIRQFGVSLPPHKRVSIGIAPAVGESALGLAGSSDPRIRRHDGSTPRQRSASGA